jgi:hypothetical protein
MDWSMLLLQTVYGRSVSASFVWLLLLQLLHFVA